MKTPTVLRTDGRTKKENARAISNGSSCSLHPPTACILARGLWRIAVEIEDGVQLYRFRTCTILQAVEAEAND